MLVRIVRREDQIANVAKSKEGVPLPLCMDPAMVWGERSNDRAFVDAVYPFLAVLYSDGGNADVMQQRGIPSHSY